MKRILALLWLISLPVYAGPKNKKRTTPSETPVPSLQLQEKTKSTPALLCNCCNTLIPEGLFTQHISECGWKKLHQLIITKPHQLESETSTQEEPTSIAQKTFQPIIIPPLDLSSSEQSTPLTPEEEMLNMQRMFDHCDKPSVFAAVDARNRYPFKPGIYLTFYALQQASTENESLKRPCLERAQE